MARHRFGGTAADFLVEKGAGNAAVLNPASTVTCYLAASGGDPVTDLTLLDGATPIEGGVLTADGDGNIGEFMGPDGVDVLYYDGSGGSGPRFRAPATDLGADIAALNATVNTPTTGLVDKVATIEAQMSGLGIGAKERPWEYVVSAATNAAVQAAISDALTQLSGNAARAKIILRPGTYNLTTPLVSQDSGNLNVIEGLEFQGSGISNTTINWSGGSTPMITAVDPRLRYFKLNNMTINSQNSASVFAYLYSTQGGVYNQRWHLEDVRFGGAWTRGFGLDGGTDGNLNSEMTFERIETDPSSSWSDAFFLCGMSNDADENQFLNYWFYDCNFSLNSGTVFRFRRGGSITIINGSWSAASTTSPAITWFDLPTQNSNNPNVTQLKVMRVRFEPKNNDHKILSCNWSDAFIEFDSCADNSSSQNTAGYDDERYTINAQNIWGGWVAPVVRFTNGSHGGFIRYVGGAQTRGGVIVEGVKWYRGNLGERAYGPMSESGASTTLPAGQTFPILQWTSGTPRYDFRNGWNYRTVANWPDVT